LTKSRKNRHLPMDAEVYTALAQLWADTPRRLEIGGAVAVNPFVFTWPNGEPFKVDWLTHEFETLVDDAKIAPCTLHDLRRSFSTIAQRAGVDRSIVKDLGGWSSLSVVEKHYSGNIQPAYEAAMEKIRKARTA